MRSDSYNINNDTYAGHGEGDVRNKFDLRAIVNLKPTLKTRGKDESGEWIIIDN